MTTYTVESVTKTVHLARGNEVSYDAWVRITGTLAALYRSPSPSYAVSLHGTTGILDRGDMRYLDHTAAVEAVAALALREAFGAEL